MTVKRYVIEQSITPGEWIVAEDKGDVSEIQFFGSAQDCIDWCEWAGAQRKGPRLYVTED